MFKQSLEVAIADAARLYVSIGIDDRSGIHMGDGFISSRADGRDDRLKGRNGSLSLCNRFSDLGRRPVFKSSASWSAEESNA